MHDMNAFERQVADEMVRIVGPSRSVDDLAIFTAVATQSPKWGFQSMFSATKFVVAAVIVALFGGFLLTGVLTTQRSDEQAPGAVSTASTEPDASEVAAPTAKPTSAPQSATTTALLPGTFNPAGTLAEARFGHTATLLPDGRVLVVGGRDIGDPRLATAEVWDPATATFSTAGSLTEARGEHTATLLLDGRVLVIGGRDGDRRLATAEVWDPATARFSPGGSLARQRYGHTATLLPDGRLLVIGGWRDRESDNFATSVEIWDPATQSFSPAGKLSGIGRGYSVTPLPDGRVLVVGGMASSSKRLFKAALVWDPATASLESAGSLAKGRANHSATLLPDGRVLFVGGGNSFDKVVASAEVWDPLTASFSPVGSLAEARGEDFTATLLPDGRVLVIGGAVDVSGVTDDVGVKRLASAEVWDPATATFSSAGSLAEAPGDHTATLLDDGRVVLIRNGNPRRPSTSAVVWDPATETFSPAGSLAEGHGAPSTTRLPDGRVLVIGGFNDEFVSLASSGIWVPGDEKLLSRP